MASTVHASGLTDTDILVDAQHAIADAVAFVTNQKAANGLRISVISAMELAIGCRSANELGLVRQFLQHVLVLPITLTISTTGYQLVDGYYLSHGLLIPDALIAATALDNNLPLYTRNVRHFQMIPGLQVIAPY